MMMMMSNQGELEMPTSPVWVPGQPEPDLLDHAHQQRGHVVVQRGGHLAQCSAAGRGASNVNIDTVMIEYTIFDIQSKMVPTSKFTH